MSWSLAYRRIICEVDCFELILLVASQSLPFHKYVVIIGDIKMLLSRDWVYYLQHVYYEVNQAEDFLVKQGAMSKTLIVQEHPLVEMGHICLADLAGVVHLRQAFLFFLFFWFSLANVQKNVYKKCIK